MPVSPLNAAWRVSSWSVTQNCVEVAGAASVVLVRDTKARSQGLLSFPPAAWKVFIEAVGTDSIRIE